MVKICQKCFRKNCTSLSILLSCEGVGKEATCIAARLCIIAACVGCNLENVLNALKCRQLSLDLAIQF